MNDLFISTFILCAEILVSASILYSFYSGYKKNKFPFVLVAVTLAYEILFNISYMAYRAASDKNPSRVVPLFTMDLAMFHGIFSIIMFLALLIFMGFAWKNYKAGANYFLKHKKITLVFILFWLIAVLSGIFVYYTTYFT